jgi:hypothetical protein
MEQTDLETGAHPAPISGGQLGTTPGAPSAPISEKSGGGARWGVASVVLGVAAMGLGFASTSTKTWVVVGHSKTGGLIYEPGMGTLVLLLLAALVALAGMLCGLVGWNRGRGGRVWSLAGLVLNGVGCLLGFHVFVA